MTHEYLVKIGFSCGGVNLLRYQFCGSLHTDHPSHRPQDGLIISKKIQTLDLKHDQAGTILGTICPKTVTIWGHPYP